MPVEKATYYKYYSMNKNGRIRSTSREERGAEYRSIWGFFCGIELITDVWRGKRIKKYHFKLRQPGSDTTEILQIREGSSAARGIIFSLMSIPEEKIRYVRFSPYRKKYRGAIYTNVWVEYKTNASGEWKGVEWREELIDHLPEQTEIELMDRVVLDDSERRKYIRGLAARIKRTKLRETEKSAADTPENHQENIYSYEYDCTALADHPMYLRHKSEQYSAGFNSDIYTYEYDHTRDGLSV